MRLTTLSFNEYLQIKNLSLPALPRPKSLRDLFEWAPSDFYRVAEIASPYVGHFHEYLVRGGFPQTAQVESIAQAQRLLRDQPGIVAIAQIGNSLRVLASGGAEMDRRIAERLHGAGQPAHVAPIATNLEDVFVVATPDTIDFTLRPGKNIVLTACDGLFDNYTYDGLRDMVLTAVKKSSEDYYLAGITVAAVPEASTWAMMGLGLVGIAAVARRRAK